MANFPTGFTETPRPLEPILDDKGNEALKRLKARNFIVVAGLTRAHARIVGAIGEQPHIAEYCPKDTSESRFANEESTARWLRKGEGRAMFLLLDETAGDQGKTQPTIEGYGWTGMAPDKLLPNHSVTSAYRLGRTAVGRRLSADFTQAIVSSTHALYAPDEGIGLETWQSNRALGLYKKVGFVVQTIGEPEQRPTINPATQDETVTDQRVYMAYPNELFDKQSSK